MTNVNSKNLVLKYEEMKHFSIENKKMDGRNLQWWRERWICRLDLVEGASIWWKEPQLPPRFGGKSPKSPRHQLQSVEVRKSLSKK